MLIADRPGGRPGNCALTASNARVVMFAKSRGRNAVGISTTSAGRASGVLTAAYRRRSCAAANSRREKPAAFPAAEPRSSIQSSRNVGIDRVLQKPVFLLPHLIDRICKWLGSVRVREANGDRRDEFDLTGRVSKQVDEEQSAFGRTGFTDARLGGKLRPTARPSGISGRVLNR